MPPVPVLKRHYLLEQKCPQLAFDYAESTEMPNLMNYYPCSRNFEESSLHWDAGGVFAPDTLEGYDGITLFLLPIETLVELECTYTLSGGEYLALERAEV